MPSHILWWNSSASFHTSLAWAFTFLTRLSKNKYCSVVTSVLLNGIITGPSSCPIEDPDLNKQIHSAYCFRFNQPNCFRIFNLLAELRMNYICCDQINIAVLENRFEHIASNNTNICRYYNFRNSQITRSKQSSIYFFIQKCIIQNNPAAINVVGI